MRFVRQLNEKVGAEPGRRNKNDSWNASATLLLYTEVMESGRQVNT
jgi:hypothetical protein